MSSTANPLFLGRPKITFSLLLFNLAKPTIPRFGAKNVLPGYSNIKMCSIECAYPGEAGPPLFNYAKITIPRFNAKNALSENTNIKSAHP